MLAYRELRWGALSLCLLVSGCAVYGPELVASSEGLDEGGNGGGGSTATSGAGGAASGAGRAGGGGEAATTSSASGNAGSGGVPPEAAPPYVRGSIDLPPIELDLTAIGFRDWAHWGLETADDYNHREGVASQLLDFKPIDFAAPELKLGGPAKIFWSDGTPTAEAETTNGIQWQGLNQGFELVAPANDEQRRMHVYLGVTAGAATISARLTDPKAERSYDETFEGAAGEWSLRLLELDYGSAEEGTRLIITYQLTSSLDSNGAVALHGVAFGAP